MASAGPVMARSEPVTAIVPESGRTSDAGLVFVAFCADPLRQFLPVQERLAEADLMNLWTTPVGSAVFAVLPGCSEGGLLGGDLVA